MQISQLVSIVLITLIESGNRQTQAARSQSAEERNLFLQIHKNDCKFQIHTPQSSS